MGNAKYLALLAVAISAGACAYKVPVTAAPNLAVYDSYGEKLPGFYLVYVDPSKCSTRLKVSGFAGSAHNYPLDCAQAFQDATDKTLANIFEKTKLIAKPVAAADLKAYGAAGMVVVTFDSVEGMFSYAEGFFESTAMANVEMQASATIDSATGRIFGSRAAGQGSGQSGSGFAGEGSVAAIAQAAEKAMRALLGQLGERIANSPRMREAAAKAPK